MKLPGRVCYAEGLPQVDYLALFYRLLLTNVNNTLGNVRFPSQLEFTAMNRALNEYVSMIGSRLALLGNQLLTFLVSLESYLPLQLVQLAIWKPTILFLPEYDPIRSL